MRKTTTLARVLIGFAESDASLSGADFINEYGLFSGTLYPILRRLEREGWVESKWESGDPKELGRPLRRLYQLTSVGQQEAEKVLKDSRTRKLFGQAGEEPIRA